MRMIKIEEKKKHTPINTKIKIRKLLVVDITVTARFVIIQYTFRKNLDWSYWALFNPLLDDLCLENQLLVLYDQRAIDSNVGTPISLHKIDCIGNHYISPSQLRTDKIGATSFQMGVQTINDYTTFSCALFDYFCFLSCFGFTPSATEPCIEKSWWWWSWWW